MMRSIFLTAGLTLWLTPAAFAEVSLDHTGIADQHQVSENVSVDHRGIADQHQVSENVSADPIAIAEDISIDHTEIVDQHQVSSLSKPPEDVREIVLRPQRAIIGTAKKRQRLPVVSPPTFSGIPGPTIRWVGELKWAGASTQEIAFMRQVYIRQMERAATKATFQSSGIGENVVLIESGQSALPEAAKACRAMLKAARQSEGATRFSVLSAYRSARKQFINWQLNFPEYYHRTATERSRLSGGEFGNDAVERLAIYTEQRLSSPGYSLHNGGTAVDFITWEGGREFSALTQPDVLAGWKQTWLFHWLRENAERFRFFQNAGIDEPWHWEYRPLVHASPQVFIQGHILHNN